MIKNIQKQCSRCHKFKGLIYFFRHKRGLYGHDSQCRECCYEYKRLIKLGLDGKIKNKLEKKYRSRGGKGHRNKNGYVYVYRPDHPNAKGNKYITQHRIVMSEHLGRPLKEKETVHHKNGIKHDNRIENLELFDHSHGPGEKVTDKIKWCINFLHSYGYSVRKDN